MNNFLNRFWEKPTIVFFDFAVAVTASVQFKGFVLLSFSPNVKKSEVKLSDRSHSVMFIETW